MIPRLRPDVLSRFNISLDMGLEYVGDRNYVAGPDHSKPILVFNTTLTVDRQVLLLEAFEHCVFRVVRKAGAFNLTVKSAKTGTTLKVMPANTWADFIHDGQSWVLVAYGAL